MGRDAEPALPKEFRRAFCYVSAKVGRVEFGLEPLDLVAGIAPPSAPNSCGSAEEFYPDEKGSLSDRLGLVVEGALPEKTESEALGDPAHGRRIAARQTCCFRWRRQAAVRPEKLDVLSGSRIPPG